LPEEGKKRGTATCKHCKFLVRNSIPENFLRHLQQCVGCPPSVRLEMAIVQRKSNEAAEMRASRRASQDISGAVATPASAHKRQKLDSGASSSHCDGLPSWRASQLDGLLLQWLLSSDVAFSSVRDPAFMALASALLPAWRPPGTPTVTLRTLSRSSRFTCFAQCCKVAACLFVSKSVFQPIQEHRGLSSINVNRSIGKCECTEYDTQIAASGADILRSCLHLWKSRSRAYVYRQTTFVRGTAVTQALNTEVLEVLQAAKCGRHFVT
jgi:hypothetical protein